MPGLRHSVKLADIFVVINGHTLGPFVAVLPQDARGDDVAIDEGDDVHVVISPRTSGMHATKARGTLQRS